MFSKSDLLAAMIAQSQAEYAAAWNGLVAQSTSKGDARFVPVQTGAGVGLIVRSCSFGKVEVEAVLAGEVEPVEIIATQDGLGYVAEWHDGPETGPAIYVERWCSIGRRFHGFIDPTTRRIVQAG